MGKPVRRFFCMQKGVVKRDDLDSGTPKRGSSCIIMLTIKYTKESFLNEKLT